jgi:hypothetical protein
MKTKTKTKLRKIWKDEYYIDFYRLAESGLTLQQILKQAKVSAGIFKRWKQSRPALQYALDLGWSKSDKKKRATSTTMQDYIYARLPSHLQELWIEVNRCASDSNGVTRLERLFDEHGEAARKHLWLYAFTRSHFNPSQACKKVGISYNSLKKWIENDPDFASLVDEVHYHKKNFIESKLMELIEEKDTQAVLMANRSLNKDRGYGEKMEVEHSGKVAHEHKNLIDVSMLPMKLQAAVLKVLDQTEQKLLEEVGHESTNGR